MKRGRPLARRSDKARRIAVRRAELRIELLEERGPMCERCKVREWTDMDERLPRSGGGDPTDKAQINTLCAFCHRWKHANPKQAREQGWTVSRYG